MSSAAKVEEVPATTVAQTEAPAVSTEEKAATAENVPDKPIVAEPTPEVAASVETAEAAEPVIAESPKEVEKPEESPKAGLLKGFQQRLVGVFPKKAEKVVELKDDKKEEKKLEAEGKEEEEKETKQRSVSRKRNSLLGGFGIGKKDDKSAAVESTADTASANVEPSKAAEAAPESVSKTTEQPSSPETVTERPGLSKRTSIFDTFKNHFAKKEKAEVAPVKEAEAVSETAPVIPAVGSTEPLSQAAAVPESTPEVPVPAEAKVEKTSKFEKRKSSLPFGLGLNKKERAPTSDEEPTEKPLSPFAKLRATVKSKASPKFIAEKEEELAPTPEVKVEPETVAAPAIESEAPKQETAAVAAPAVAS